MDDVSAVPPRIAKFLADLKEPSTEVHMNEVFEDVRVILDGRAFFNCTFRRCQMTLLTGAFSFSGEQQFIDCTWDVGGPVEAALKFLDYIRGGGGESGPLN